MRRVSASVPIAAPRERVFEFHADATNLARGLPGAVPFRSVGPSRLERDAVLRFRFGPLVGKGVVRVWEPPLRFVDEQTFGPFALWRHEHRFNELAGRTWVTDIVEFALRRPARPLEVLAQPVVQAVLRAKLRRTKAVLEARALP
jgi:ligand-binding SRPBCC domain-containing protein